MNTFVRGFAVGGTLITIFACGMLRHPASGPRAAQSRETAGSCEENTIVPPDAQFPFGFDYPQTSTAVHDQWSTNGGGHRARLHAFCLFAGLNVMAPPPLNIPTWRTWKTASQAFPNQYNKWKPTGPDGAPLPGAAASQPLTINESRSRASGRFGDIRNKGPIYGVNDAILAKAAYWKCLVPIPDLPPNTPPLYKLKDGQVFQSNGDIMIATVSYNTPALNNILEKGLYNADVLDGQLPDKEQPPTTLESPMPAGSIVLKAMFWPVAGGPPSLTALPVWDWDRNKPGSLTADNRYAGYEMQQFWKRAVAISSAPVVRKNTTAAVAFLFGVRDKDGNPLPKNVYGAPIVGLDRFYSLSSAQIKSLSLSDCDRAILDASAYWLYNRSFQEGDSLALIAMHIMTKEQPAWTFQSAWWHPDARDCRKPYDRFCSWGPDKVRTGDVTWQNYMMVTTYGAIQRKGRPNYSAPLTTAGATWPVMYNPYIELAATHPITTNCMNCHARAAWPPDDPDHKKDRGRSSAYLQTGSLHPNALETFTTSTGPFKGLLMLDNMWAVSDRAGYPASEAREEQPAH